MNVIEWLLDSDPSIRWQVMRDLMDESDEIVARERSRVASEGWGGRLLDLQAPDGQWGGGAYVYPGWISTTDTLLLLRDLGLDPASERARRAIGLVRDTSWGPDFDDAPFFEGEVEPCINGRVLAVGAYFGEANDRLADRLLHEQLEDGGLELRGPAEQAILVSHDDLCPRRAPGVREGERRHDCGEGHSPSVTGVSPGTPHVQVAVNGSGDRSRLDAVFVSNSLALRRPVGAGLLAESRRRTRATASRRPSIWCTRSETATGDGRSRTPTPVRSTSTWKTALARPAAGTHSGPYACCAGAADRFLVLSSHRVRGRPLAHGQPAEREGKRLNGCAREIRDRIAPDVRRFPENRLDHDRPG
jgi:hypothetical protein